MKKITRKYYNKKTGQWTTKTYEYTHKSTKGKTLVGKNGAINKENVKKYKEIIDNSNLTPMEKLQRKTYLDALVMQRHADGKKLTTTGFEGKIASDKVERMFSNMGYTVEEAAKEIGVNENDLLDNKNWSGEEFSFGNAIWVVSFTYTSGVWKKIK